MGVFPLYKKNTTREGEKEKRRVQGKNDGPYWGLNYVVPGATSSLSFLVSSSKSGIFFAVIYTHTFLFFFFLFLAHQWINNRCTGSVIRMLPGLEMSRDCPTTPRSSLWSTLCSDPRHSRHLWSTLFSSQGLYNLWLSRPSDCTPERIHPLTPPLLTETRRPS